MRYLADVPSAHLGHPGPAATPPGSTPISHLSNRRRPKAARTKKPGLRTTRLPKSTDPTITHLQVPLTGNLRPSGARRKRSPPLRDPPRILDDQTDPGDRGLPPLPPDPAGSTTSCRCAETPKAQATHRPPQRCPPRADIWRAPARDRGGREKGRANGRVSPIYAGHELVRGQPVLSVEALPAEGRHSCRHDLVAVAGVAG